jgi:DNA invertase Pin-like site-specific DNA recombinase
MSSIKRATEMDGDELREAIRKQHARLEFDLAEGMQMFTVPEVSENVRQFDELIEVPKKRFRTPAFVHGPAETFVKPPEDGIARAYGYARVSTGGQYDRDTSIPDQTLRMEHYYQFQLKSQGIQWEGVTDDGKANSARRRPFMTRSGVKSILSKISQGDHLIIDKFDRAFRDTRDFLHCSGWLERNQVNLHVLNLGGQNFQPNSPIGRMFMTMLAGFAQLEAETTSARLKDACRAARSRGYANAGTPPGTKILSKKNRKIVWDVAKRRYMALILHMRDELYMDWREMAWELHLLRSGGVAPTTNRDRERWATNQQKPVYELYAYEWFYRDCCITDPAEIPYEATVLAYSANHKKEMTSIIRRHRAEIARAKRDKSAARKLLAYSDRD